LPTLAIPPHFSFCLTVPEWYAKDFPPPLVSFCVPLSSVPQKSDGRGYVSHWPVGFFFQVLLDLPPAWVSRDDVVTLRSRNFSPAPSRLQFSQKYDPVNVHPGFFFFFFFFFSCPLLFFLGFTLRFPSSTIVLKAPLQFPSGVSVGNPKPNLFLFCVFLFFLSLTFGFRPPWTTQSGRFFFLFLIYMHLPVLHNRAKSEPADNLPLKFFPLPPSARLLRPPPCAQNCILSLGT